MMKKFAIIFSSLLVLAACNEGSEDGDIEGQQNEEEYAENNPVFAEADKEFEAFFEEVSINDWESFERALENGELRDERDSEDLLESITIRRHLSTIYVNYELSPSQWDEELMEIGSRRMNFLLDLTNNFEGYDGNEEFIRLIVPYTLGQRSTEEDVISIDFYPETGELVYHDQQAILGY